MGSSLGFSCWPCPCTLEMPFIAKYVFFCWGSRNFSLYKVVIVPLVWICRVAQS